MFRGAKVPVLVVVVFAACGGDDGGAAVDAPAGDGGGDDAPLAVDAGVDAPLVLECPPEPSNGELAYLTAKPNIDVIWHEPDGSVRTCTRTDANGRTQAKVLAGSMVTLVQFETLQVAAMLTVTGVQPGDDLLLGGPPSTVTLPRLHVDFSNVPSGATRWYYDMGCDSLSYYGTSGTSTMPQDNDIYVPCQSSDGQRINVYAEALDSGTTKIGYAIAPDVTIVSPTTTVAMSTWRTDWIDATLTLTNPPFATLSTTAWIGWRDDGVDFNDRGFDVAAAGAANGATIVTPARKLPMGLGDAVVGDVRFSTTTGTSIVVFESAGALGSRTRDVANAMTFPTALNDSWASAARPQITWQNNATIAAGDLGLTRLRYVTGGRQVDWSMLFPATATTVQYPALPTGWSIGTPSTANVQEGRLGLVDNDEFASYDALRNGGFLHPQFGAGSVADFRGRYSISYF